MYTGEKIMDNFDWNDDLPEISFLCNNIKFNKAAVSILGAPDKISIGFDSSGKNVFAVRPAQAGDKMIFTLSGKNASRSVYLQGGRLLKKISHDYYRIMHRKKGSVSIKLTELPGKRTLICDYTELLKVLELKD